MALDVMETVSRLIRQQPGAAAVLLVMSLPVMYLAGPLLLGTLPFLLSAALVAVVSPSVARKLPQRLTIAAAIAAAASLSTAVHSSDCPTPSTPP